MKLRIHCLSGHGIAISLEVAMPASSVVLGLRACAGDGAVPLAFNRDSNELKTNALAGFTIQCAPPSGAHCFRENRPNVSNPVTASTVSQQTRKTQENQRAEKGKRKKRTVPEA
jgi:hypothetical protein